MRFPEGYIIVGAVKLGTSVAMIGQLAYTSARFYHLQEASTSLFPSLICNTHSWITFSHVYVSFLCLNLGVIGSY